MPSAILSIRVSITNTDGWKARLKSYSSHTIDDDPIPQSQLIQAGSVYHYTSDTTGRARGTATEQRIQRGANFHAAHYWTRGGEVGQTGLKNGEKESHGRNESRLNEHHFVRKSPGFAS
jgi:hypothetical protein